MPPLITQMPPQLAAGVTLLPASSVEALLLEKRRHELVQPFKLALLKLASQVCVCGGVGVCGISSKQLNLIAKAKETTVIDCLLLMLQPHVTGPEGFVRRLSKGIS